MTAFNSVVLPLPAAPKRIRVSPGLSVSEISFSAVTVPNCKLTFLNSSSGAFSSAMRSQD